MFRISGFTIFFILVFPAAVSAQQTNERVRVIPRILEAAQTAGVCKKLEPGKIVFFLPPEYPAGPISADQPETVRVRIVLDEKGFFYGIAGVEGDSPFLEEGIKAAQKVRFTPSLCDGKPVSISAEMTYIFSQKNFSLEYYVPEKTEEYADLTLDSPYYEPIFYLTENYKLSFGYADRKFHENAPLTRRDFTHFLRLTLDLLSERARAVGKDPVKMKLIRSYDPFRLGSAERIRDLEPQSPAAESVRKLFTDYQIALVNRDLELRGPEKIPHNEVIEIWRRIFGEEALPIHFSKKEDDRAGITRGEFALFLLESLRVLTYKLLP